MALVYFTFGQDHISTYPLPRGGRLADYWVTIDTPVPANAREVFIERFTKKYCPQPSQFAFEYTESEWKPEFFPKGELCKIHA